ncbi:phage tail protein [Asticcacaulis sp. ZE23SCel15]|uniref:phage tail protein n=1 Tax=Asticcacaulis sp. ZE23SCel15 TaxID=3059027 RepID=UPI00265DBFA1|nr:phage tail protein [Asticcacaulis sp. ZE23SCel15]WKL55998.1 phage tail protein [Asticcacaulis sp. ZE23SCel15]
MSWRHAQTDRFMARPALQYVGPGEETITLSGALFGGVIGNYGAIEQVRELADTGDAYTMVSGTGEVLGEWIILSLEEKRSNFFVDGMHRKADFTIELKRGDDAQSETATEAAQ